MSDLCYRLYKAHPVLLLFIIRIISTDYIPNPPLYLKSIRFVFIIVIEVKFLISKPLAAPDPWHEQIRIVIRIIVGRIEPTRQVIVRVVGGLFRVVIGVKVLSYRH